MRRTSVAAAAALMGFMLTRAARAADPESPRPAVNVARSHKGQVGAHAQVGMGYRVLFPFDGEYCGQAGKEVCSAASPPFLDIGVSYGVLQSLEIIVELRVGLGRDFKPAFGPGDGPRALVIAPGLKIYVDDSGPTKFFSTIQAAIDRTAFDANDTATDLGLRNCNGVQVDFNRNLGLYVHFGATIGALRWLRFELDGGLGLQGRFL